jgi:hypothetical protein
MLAIYLKITYAISDLGMNSNVNFVDFIHYSHLIYLNHFINFGYFGFKDQRFILNCS